MAEEEEDLTSPSLVQIPFSKIRFRTTSSQRKFITEKIIAPPSPNVGSKRGVETGADTDRPSKRPTTIMTKDVDWDSVVQPNNNTTTSSSGESITTEDNESEEKEDDISSSASTPPKIHPHLVSSDPVLQIREAVIAISNGEPPTKFVDLEERADYEECFFCDYAEPEKNSVTHAGVKTLYSTMLRSRETANLDNLCVSLYRIYKSEIYEPAIKRGLAPPEWSAHGIKIHMLDHMNDDESWHWKTLSELSDIRKALMVSAWFKEEESDRIVPDVKVIGLHRQYVKMEYDMRMHNVGKLVKGSMEELKNFVFGTSDSEYFIKPKMLSK